ncbi:hypothetical protein EMIHUDRAFT_436377 [Emiliania huxleyi CCMP1516]|uniref:Uncharacterized protein n=3 Tax=Emiliania huxleyi TaxID=2903 RepID=A0A0D3J1H3_EMIH1|nr:hypothetical protein EMIHUDRAFT_445957 [Emiliania huxleyi CCMP1516]XP_005769787.1 hypothetical protein EMIHUDRAFT_436377 [Emiliania huxleyi CCMP1516]EOD12567.1 hypothetical protein EMIHUDRAFT_445957 [Emiliania huxleyi CCMP1516]EOD17358.1 hypothetical protein EMIHUDRAFT_436377 [Emiliania huxleyi CCMP1516]|eukprot:XP_005764996.1 hypothetical protein EMIHUDRAFT_445957 [Emiliania huxleyi CCMP1516]
MIESGKGIYIKSNPECGIDEVAGAPKAAIISNILYEDILIDRPRWWAIWIGPQQQHEPHSSLGLKCALDYPLSRHCPTQGCVTFANITLRNVHIERPLISPGVIKGNATSPITGLAFDNVTVSRPGRFPFGASYECEHASGRAVGSSPPPACLLPGVLSSW